jgi:peptide/nickel transport system permease protein
VNSLDSTHPWLAFVLRRVTRLVVSLFVVASVVFLMISLVPGDPVRAALGPTAPVSLVNQRRHALGLDKPLLTQFLDYWHRLLTGELGTSITSDLPVTSVVRDRVANSAELIGLSILLTLVLAVTFGMIFGALTQSGRRPRTLIGFTVTSSVINTIPSFLTGILLVYVFAVSAQLLPVAGSAGFESLILPAIALSLGPAAGLARIVRAQTDFVLSEDYMRVARGKRLPARLLYLRHALPNLLTAALTIGGLLLGVIVAGSVVVETVFARAGLGTAVVQAITARDYPLVQGILLVLAAAVLVVNLLVDVLLGLVDRQSLIARS